MPLLSAMACKSFGATNRITASRASSEGYGERVTAGRSALVDFQLLCEHVGQQLCLRDFRQRHMAFVVGKRDVQPGIFHARARDLPRPKTYAARRASAAIMKFFHSANGSEMLLNGALCTPVPEINTSST
jgi:hypothetical protein